jgi:predicted ATPase
MKYADIIQFQPIQSVIELRRERDANAARELISTYVISDEMAKRIASVIFPHLQFEKPHDNKGLFIVGNYGSGKSHLMSVLAEIAADASLAQYLTNDTVADKASSIAGKFKVLRMEIPASQMLLREILTGELESFLGKLGVSYQFPPADRSYLEKANLEAMMAAFHEKYPDHGLVVIADEILEFLNSQKDHELIHALSILRQLGEAAQDLRFRFVAGVQESIFESGRFAHVAETLLKVRDRFEQVRIAPTDIQYVVAHRLLHKTPEQRQMAREHLEPFAKFYGDMTEKMEAFCDLFPVHPTYIAQFEDIPIVEKRGVLQVISEAMTSLLELEIPKNEPGIIAADSFWKRLVETPSFKAVPDVADVIHCSHTLETKITSGFTKKAYQALALRIIQGLSVHRLTTGDIHSRIGMTPEEMRDAWCLFHPMAGELGGEPDEDLLSLVESTLREIRKTVSGQFLSSNEDNRQFFLDLKKTDDYDALIEKRAESIGDETLNRRYFDVMLQVLEQSDVQRHVPGASIWQYQIIWGERNAGRLGYLFFGTPEDRPTAIPQREFYIYLIPPFDPPRFKDEKKADEVFFRLAKPDETFKSNLELYAAAADLANTASGVKKTAYQDKANGYFRSLAKWLRENLLRAVHVTYQGDKKTLAQWLQGGGGGPVNVRGSLNGAATRCLAEHFADCAPEYPFFSEVITYPCSTEESGNAEQAAREALRGLNQNPRSKQANSILDALGLLDGDRVDPSSSVYAKELRKRLEAKPHGQVLNRSEIFETFDSESFFAINRFRLEPVWVAVILGAMVHSGDVVLAIPGRKFDATNIAELTATPVDDLSRFKHLERPKDWNMPALRALFELAGMAPGNAVAVSQNTDGPVRDLQVRVGELVHRLVLTRQQVKGGIPFWGQSLLTDAEIDASVAAMAEAQEFLESLQAYNTPGKLKNFRHTEDDVKVAKQKLQRLTEVEDLEKAIRDLSGLAHYLSQAASALPPGDDWVTRQEKLQEEVRAGFKDPQKRHDPSFRDESAKKLQALKDEYITLYLTLYAKARLNLSQDKARNDLLKDDRLKSLQQLTAIGTMPTLQLTEFQNAANGLRTGQNISQKDLETTPKADFWPSMEKTDVSAGQRLTQLQGKLGEIYQAWTQRLLDDLQDPVIQANLELLKPDQRSIIEGFVTTGELPDKLDGEFIEALREMLSGLTKVSLSLPSLEQTLFPDGSPCTASELRARFDSFMTSLLQGKDTSRVRIVSE